MDGWCCVGGFGEKMEIVNAPKNEILLDGNVFVNGNPNDPPTVVTLVDPSFFHYYGLQITCRLSFSLLCVLVFVYRTTLTFIVSSIVGNLVDSFLT